MASLPWRSVALEERQEDIHKYQQGGLFLRSDKQIQKDILTSIWPWRPWRGPGVSLRAAAGSCRRRLGPRRSQSSSPPVCVEQSAEKRGVNKCIRLVVMFQTKSAACSHSGYRQKPDVSGCERHMRLRTGPLLTCKLEMVLPKAFLCNT